jgi:hypothetical protein
MVVIVSASTMPAVIVIPIVVVVIAVGAGPDGRGRDGIGRRCGCCRSQRRGAGERSALIGTDAAKRI